jgi:hypothetical protein
MRYLNFSTPVYTLTLQELNFFQPVHQAREKQKYGTKDKTKVFAINQERVISFKRTCNLCSTRMSKL